MGLHAALGRRHDQTFAEAMTAWTACSQTLATEALLIESGGLHAAAEAGEATQVATPAASGAPRATSANTREKIERSRKDSKGKLLAGARNGSLDAALSKE